MWIELESGAFFNLEQASKITLTEDSTRLIAKFGDEEVYLTEINDPEFAQRIKNVIRDRIGNGLISVRDHLKSHQEETRWNPWRNFSPTESNYFPDLS